MILENLETEHLVRIANVFMHDNWKPWFDIGHGWKGFDLLGDEFIFQLSYEGSIRIYDKNTVKQIELSSDHEDMLRKILNEILRNNGTR